MFLNEFIAFLIFLLFARLLKNMEMTCPPRLRRRRRSLAAVIRASGRRRRCSVKIKRGGALPPCRRSPSYSGQAYLLRRRRGEKLLLLLFLLAYTDSTRRLPLRRRPALQNQIYQRKILTKIPWKWPNHLLQQRSSSSSKVARVSSILRTATTVQKRWTWKVSLQLQESIVKPIIEGEWGSCSSLGKFPTNLHLLLHEFNKVSPTHDQGFFFG